MIKSLSTGLDPNCGFPVTFNNVTSYIMIKLSFCKFNFWNYHNYLCQEIIETICFLFVWILLKVDYFYEQIFFYQVFFQRTLIFKIFFHVNGIDFIIFLHIAISEFTPLQLDFILNVSWGGIMLHLYVRELCRECVTMRTITVSYLENVNNFIKWN